MNGDCCTEEKPKEIAISVLLKEILKTKYPIILHSNL